MLFAYTRHIYQVSVYRTIGPLVYVCVCLFVCLFCSFFFSNCKYFEVIMNNVHLSVSSIESECIFEN